MIGTMAKPLDPIYEGVRQRASWKFTPIPGAIRIEVDHSGESEPDPQPSVEISVEWIKGWIAKAEVM